MKRYILAMIIGIIVLITLITERNEFASEASYKIGIIIVIVYFGGIAGMVIRELRK